MEIKINKEIRDYQESIFLGLSLRQFLFSLLAVGGAVGCYFGLRDILGVETVSWVCVAIALPFALMGFVKYHGMTLEQFIKAYVISEILMPKQLCYRPSNLYAEILQDEKKSVSKEALRHD